jgi:RND family efflux transporter MFP subunit
MRRLLNLSLPLRRCGLAFAAAMAMLGCQRAPVETPAATSETAAPADFIHPERTAIRVEVSNPATIEAFEETAIFAKIAGYVKSGWKDRGDILKKDQLLAELWVPEREVEVLQKEALVSQATSEIEQASQMVKVAEAAFESSKAKVTATEAKLLAVQARCNRLKSQFDRMVGLPRVVNKENVEEAELGYLTGRANLAQAEADVKDAQAFQVESKARWDKAKADLKVAEDHRRVAREESKYARTMLEYARLPAPYDCIVTQRHVVTGDFVQMPANGAGKPLFVVHRTDLMRVVVQVPEKDTEWIRAGVSASVCVPKLQNQTFAGPVARISWSLNEATRTLRAEIDLPNPDGRLRPGMYAYVTLNAELPNVLTLPRSAVATEGDVTRGYQTFCYEVRDGQRQRLNIELGVGDRNRVHVLKKQLPSDRPDESPRWGDFTGKEAILRYASPSAVPAPR